MSHPRRLLAYSCVQPRVRISSITNSAGGQLSAGVRSGIVVIAPSRRARMRRARLELLTTAICHVASSYPVRIVELRMANFRMPTAHVLTPGPSFALGGHDS